jgi:hypothetical protein
MRHIDLLRLSVSMRHIDLLRLSVSIMYMISGLPQSLTIGFSPVQSPVKNLLPTPPAITTASMQITFRARALPAR